MREPTDYNAALDVVLTSGSIRYSQVWEDHNILAQALQINSDDHVISIASAGCNGLALLLQGPQSLTLVDLNPAQTALCSLKIAGIRRLGYEDFLGLMGARPCPERWSIAQRLFNDLSEDALGFWMQNRTLIEGGLLHGGRLDEFFGNYRTEHLSRWHDQTTIRAFCASHSLDTQKRFFNEVIATPDFIENFCHYFSRDNFAKHGRSPAQFEHVGEIDVGRYFFKRFRHACTQLPIKANPYIEFFLTGAYADIENGPLYMRASGFNRLKSLVERTDVVTCKIDEYLETMPQGHYTKANLSNIFEYLSADQTSTLMGNIASQMQTGARLAYWNFLVPRSPDVRLAGLLKVDQELSARLWADDRSWVYRNFEVMAVGL
jgi:S-adenosylmethionine-diacylglycerol 3-amino-3-carboxypropyl transferase